MLLLLFVEDFVVVTWWWWCCCLWRRSPCTWWSPGSGGAAARGWWGRGRGSGGGSGGDLLELPDNMWDIPTIIWKASPPNSHLPTQLHYVCLRTLNPLEVDFFNLYFGHEKLERMVGSTHAYVEDHIDNYSSYQTTVPHGLLWHSMSFFRHCRLCYVLLGQQKRTRIFCSDCKRDVERPLLFVWW